MIKNYFKIAFRNIWKNKVFSLINISGLSIAISASLVIYLIVQFEFSYEKSRKDADRIYRMVTHVALPGEPLNKGGYASVFMAKSVRTDLPEVEMATYFIIDEFDRLKVAVPHEDSKPPTIFEKQTDIVFADEYYFSLFECDWLAGSKLTALKEPFQVVLTDDIARTYFGNIAAADIIGKKIIFHDTITTTVTGIIKNPVDKATDLHFKEFISLATVMNTNLQYYIGIDGFDDMQLFVKLKPSTKLELIDAKLEGLRNKFYKQDPLWKAKVTNHLQPLTDIHFNAEYGAFNHRQAHKPTLYGLMAVAAFLLLLGCINFINLTTAQATRRSKEIGIKKILGSSKWNLIFQFLIETFFLTLIATVISIVIMPWLLAIFKDFIPPEITMVSLKQVHIWGFMAILIFLMTLLSGLYPAIVLTKFKPVTVLKNQITADSIQSRKAWFRKTLTVTQFLIAQFLVIATLVVSKQINYSLNKDLGYKKDAIVFIYMPENMFSNKKDDRRFVFFEKLKSIPGIEKISLGGGPPANRNISGISTKMFNGSKEVELMVERQWSDSVYFDIYKMKLVAGKIYGQNDTLPKYLVNEAFARAYGYINPPDIVGQYIQNNIPIVGVLKDFQARSTREPIKPYTYQNYRKGCYTIHLALKSEAGSPRQWKATFAKVEKEFRKLYPDDDFNIIFFDQTIAEFYKAEQDIARLLNWSAGLCIFISCLGLLGLVIFTTNSRTKEIGVRKVLGASISQIVTLLSKDLVSLVLVAFVIAAPLAWLAMNKWLQAFAYRTQMSWWVFAACGISMLLIALVVLSIRTIGAAIANPVKSLRTE